MRQTARLVTTRTSSALDKIDSFVPKLSRLRQIAILR